MNMTTALAHQIAHRHDHAAKCKHDTSECKVCQDNMKFFAELPLPLLSEALQDRQARTFKKSLGIVVFDNVTARHQHQSRRAKADFRETALLFKFHKHHYPNAYKH
jgi:hypothetical protein